MTKLSEKEKKLLKEAVNGFDDEVDSLQSEYEKAMSNLRSSLNSKIETIKELNDIPDDYTLKVDDEEVSFVEPDVEENAKRQDDDKLTDESEED